MRENTAKSFVRVWKVMEMCYQVLNQEGKKVTQRELFYKLLCDSQEYFKTQLQVNSTIQDLVALLQCSRYSLGIMASSRGAVSGRLLLQASSSYPPLPPENLFIHFRLNLLMFTDYTMELVL
ncbi:unnamed protein product [Cuscuta epithymum]|uniref:Spo11/DNA topoisomerase VI subunit A N-terminal domain-containing protein n=1 Tax=Cuscuta epithymum TaxID=186058 RepID=A0AAV0F9E9_9ASTE|nr:unnamed protein product [Cuscuta epithymum]